MNIRQFTCRLTTLKSRFLPGAWPGCALLAAVLLALAGPAQSSTPLEQELASYNGWQLKWFHLEGVPDGLGRDLRRGLAFSGKSRFLRRAKLPEFQTSTLLDDIARIRLFLAREGFPAARVTAEVDPLAKDRRLLGLTLRVDPGPAVQVTEVTWHDWPEGLARPDTASGDYLGKGDRFGDLKLAQSRDFLQRHLRNVGFALAEVRTTLHPLSPTQVEITYSVKTNQYYEITEISVQGCSEDLSDLTRYLLDIKPPVEFSQKKIDDAGFNLRSTQLYRQVNFAAEPVGPGQLHLLASVENARMRSLETSVGTFSDNPWMVRAGWAHRNLFKGGKGFDVKGALATHNREIGVGLTWFGWFSPRGRTRLGAQNLYEDEDAYESREWRLDLRYSVQPRERDLFQTGVSISRVDLVTYTDLEQDFTDHVGILTEVWADRKWDRTDDPLYPTRKGFFKLRTIVSPPGPVSESPYLLVQGDLSQYRSFGSGIVAAGRVRAGYARPLGSADDLIANRRFYAGGYTTMRGYGRRGLGPRDDEGTARGGNTILLGGLELRVPLFWLVELSLFLDSGQVWRQARDVDLADIEAAWGTCLDLRTPLGPVRFGYAWNITEPYSGEPDGLFHFGVGYPW